MDFYQESRRAMSKFLLCSYSSSCEGTREVRAYDYADFHVLMLERMYQQRLKGYAELGYQTLSDDAESTPSIIYLARKSFPKGQFWYCSSLYSLLLSFRKRKNAAFSGIFSFAFDFLSFRDIIETTNHSWGTILCQMESL